MTDLFKEKSKDWDANQMRLELAKNISGAIVENVAIAPHMRALDFGAGTGLVTSRLAPLLQHITALDTSRSMLDKLLEKEELKTNVTALCGDIFSGLLKETKEFDLIVSAMALHHVEDTPKLIETFANHLKPGGTIALADLDEEDGSFHPPGTDGVFHNGINRDRLSQILLQHGFHDIKYFPAHSITKEGAEYTIFLVVARLES